MWNDKNSFTFLFESFELTIKKLFCRQNDYVKYMWWIYILCLRYWKMSFFKNDIRICFLTTNNRLLHILYHSISLKNGEERNFENSCLGNVCDPIFTPFRTKKLLKLAKSKWTFHTLASSNRLTLYIDTIYHIWIARMKNTWNTFFK